MVFLDLCSGAGIGAVGIEKYYSIDSAIDYNKDALTSYNLNHEFTRTYLKDIRDISFVQKDYQSIAVSSTTPCTQYTQLNKDQVKKNDFISLNLLDESIRAITEIKPEFGLSENVFSVPSDRKERFINQLRKLNYKVVSKIINAHEFGSAQIRKRWLVTFSKSKHIFPEKTQTRKFAKDILNHRITSSEITPRPATLEKIQQLESGKWVSLPDQSYKVYFVIDENKPLPAFVNPTKLRYIFPDRTRYLALSELIKAFGLDSYKLVGSLTSKGQQIANGFPVELAEAFAKAFYNYYGDLN